MRLQINLFQGLVFAEIAGERFFIVVLPHMNFQYPSGSEQFIAELANDGVHFLVHQQGAFGGVPSAAFLAPVPGNLVGFQNVVVQARALVVLTRTVGK